MAPENSGRLSFFEATWIVARRDFQAMVMSKMFLIFLLGPLFTLMITAMVSAILIGGSGSIPNVRPELVVSMDRENLDRIAAARQRIGDNIKTMPEIYLTDQIREGSGNHAWVLEEAQNNAGGVLYGTIEDPKLIVRPVQDAKMTTAANLLIAEARRQIGTENPENPFPNIQSETLKSQGFEPQGGFLSSKLTQFLLYILTSTMAVMVLSNLAEEKSNRIVEVLATAIPMESLFAGKLAAMLATTSLALSVWATFGGLAWFAAGGTGEAISMFLRPSIGWIPFIMLFIIYFFSSYLFIGAIYLTIGGITPTARDAQTFTVPASIIQITACLFGTWASSAGGSIPWIAASIPLVSPYTLAGYAAESDGILIHFYGIGLQIIFVTLIIKYGSTLFRKRIINSGRSMRSLIFKKT